MLYTKHQYDTSDRIASQSWQIGEEAFSESYIYREEDGKIESMSIGDETIQYTYNGLQQPKKQITKNLNVTYTYRAIDVQNKIVSNQIGVLQYLKPGTTEEVLPTVNYTYDSVGNITTIQSGTQTAEYTYDDQNQLTQEILPSQTSDYGYDTYGNIRSKTVTDSQGETETYTFTYGNENWLDQLTEVSYTNKNGTNTTLGLSYDAIGNPTSYFNGKSNWEIKWQYGRELAEIKNKSTDITSEYTYNENGIRESKTVGDVKHDYITLDDKVIRETYEDTNVATTIDYFYDAQGRAYKIVAKAGSTTYVGYFVLNQQGDTIALLDENGAVAVTYEYDARGKEVSHTAPSTLGSKLYQYNALKYRGYYYDAESGFYYLQSRYYDPEIGRFINADSTDVLGVQGDFADLNLYAYCNNNPVNLIDVNGCFGITFSTVALTIVLTISAYSMYLSIKRAITKGTGLKSLLRTFPKINIKKIIMTLSGTSIPNRLIDKRTGNVDLGKFNQKVKGKTAYKESGGWVIDKDETGHKGKWKLKDKKGKRVGTLDENGKVVGK